MKIQCVLREQHKERLLASSRAVASNRALRKTYSNVSVNSIEASTSPRATPLPRAFELFKIGLFKFPPLGAKKVFKNPTK